MKISATDCSHKKLFNLAQKCGFIIFEGKSHTKVKNRKGQLIATIPRHNRLKREIARGIIKSLRVAGCKI